MGWYEGNQRALPWRETRDPYRIWVSEVMLQQTRVDTVIPYYHRFLRRFPNVAALAAADREEVLKAWEGLGYYGRARNLHRAARMVDDELDGVVPGDRKAFQRLPGVGDYISAAVLSIAFNQPFAVVDGNVKRVLARICKIETPVNTSPGHKSVQKKADALLDRSRPSLFNQAVMELGALVCTPAEPDCGACPVSSFCRAFRDGSVSEFPRKQKKKATPTRTFAVGVVRDNAKMLIVRRPSRGLLGGLWEFPGGEIGSKETPEEACIRGIREQTGLVVDAGAFVARVRHAYSHFKVVMNVYVCGLVSGEIRLNGHADHRWAALHELAAHPFHKAVHKFLPLLEEAIKRNAESSFS